MAPGPTHYLKWKARMEDSHSHEADDYSSLCSCCKQPHRKGHLPTSPLDLPPALPGQSPVGFPQEQVQWTLRMVRLFCFDLIDQTQKLEGKTDSHNQEFRRCMHLAFVFSHCYNKYSSDPLREEKREERARSPWQAGRLSCSTLAWGTYLSWVLWGMSPTVEGAKSSLSGEGLGRFQSLGGPNPVRMELWFYTLRRLEEWFPTIWDS